MASKETKSPPKQPNSAGVENRKVQLIEKKFTAYPLKVTNIEFQASFCDAVNRGLINPTGPQSQQQHKQVLTKTHLEKTQTLSLEDRCDKLLDNEQGSLDKTRRRSDVLVHGETKFLKRETIHRIFVNRSLSLEKIKFFGFDMDYTLAVYQSPKFESLCFNAIIDKLILVGYPKAIKESYEYDPSFPVRGMWFDSKFGTMLKMDPYGNILVAMKGFKVLNSLECHKLYPTMFVQYDDSRIYIMNTLFTLPELYSLACLVHHFLGDPAYNHSDPTGFTCGPLSMSYKSILRDVRDAVDFVHLQGKLKEETIARLSEFVVKDSRLPLLLNRMRCHGAKTFLLTNSGYEYTHKVMSYLLDGIESVPAATPDIPSTDQVEGDEAQHQLPHEHVTPGHRVWTSYFDYILVDANKPQFFTEGNTLREVDTVTTELKLGVHVGPLNSGQVYSGGSCDVFSSLIGAKGKDVLYVGDHIFGDILKSKKTRGWRTFLVVPEMTLELYVWMTRRHLIDQLHDLELQLSEAYLNMDSRSTSGPDVTELRNCIQKVTHQLDLEYGIFGSLFKSGSRQTFFASQVLRYADLYGASCLNLLHYPFCYLFKAPPMLMPHESTVPPEHFQLPLEEQLKFDLRSRRLNRENIETSTQDDGSHVTDRKVRLSLMAETPKLITHHHDDDELDSVDATVARRYHKGIVQGQEHSSET